MVVPVQVCIKQKMESVILLLNAEGAKLMEIHIKKFGQI
jgi:hypothetical protein